MGLFTVELEFGPETRATIERAAAMVERAATTAAVELELGPHTREVMAHFFESTAESGDSGAREKIGGLIGKATSGE